MLFRADGLTNGAHTANNDESRLNPVPGLAAIGVGSKRLGTG